GSRGSVRVCGAAAPRAGPPWASAPRPPGRRTPPPASRWSPRSATARSSSGRRCSASSPTTWVTATRSWRSSSRSSPDLQSCDKRRRPGPFTPGRSRLFHVTTHLADLTTLRVGGIVRNVISVQTEAEFINEIRAADEARTPLLVVGGGSNLLAAASPSDGVVIRDAREEIRIESQDACGGAAITVTAGTPWEDVVEAAVTNGWMGMEALTGIPGSTGATPVQNVGAYGQEVSDIISSVRCWDRVENRGRTVAAVDVKFGYRTSIIKRSIGQLGYTPRYVVLSVSFQMRLASLSAPIPCRTRPHLRRAPGKPSGGERGACRRPHAPTRKR